MLAIVHSFGRKSIGLMAQAPGSALGLVSSQEKVVRSGRAVGTSATSDIEAMRRVGKHSWQH